MCVFGAGIAGLVTTKVLRDDDFQLATFEKEATLGGVWAASRTYPGLRANNPRETYAFSDHPYPPSADEYPTAEQVRGYLESYANRFGLRPWLRFSTEVARVRRATGGGFEVDVRPAERSGPVETERFDLVAVCNGVFSVPLVPRIPGRERFTGHVVHSSEATDPALVAGARVVVVGAGKSALDCATWAAVHGRACTLIFRAPHWMVPRWFFGIVRMDRVIMTRFAEAFLRYHRPSRFESFLHGRARPLVRAYWRGASGLIRRLVRMPAAMTPETPLPAGFENTGIGGEFYAVLRTERLTPKRASLAAFCGPSTLELDTGERLEVDVVVCATGWSQETGFLDGELRRAVERDGAFHLYRHILPPAEPRLGFVGYASSTACQLTSEIAAHWLSQHFRGELRLPSREAMEHEIAAVRRWAAEIFPARQQGYFIGPYFVHAIDDLLRDMGLRTARRRNPLAEYFGPVWPDRYREIGEERRRARRAVSPPCAAASS